MTPDPARAVAVTGLGIVSPFGWGLASFCRGLERGETAIRRVSRFDPSTFRTQQAAQVPDLREESGRRGRVRSTLADRYALAAAREGLLQAGLSGDLQTTSCGVFFGSSTGGMWESEEYFASLLNSSKYKVSRLVDQQPSGPAEVVARSLRVEGPVVTIASACASATLALGVALASLREGEVDVALAGGADSFCRLTFAGFNSLRAVDPQACRPFRAERQGMSLGEGAAVLVLEPIDRAHSRGATILGYLLGAGGSCDGHHMTSPDPEGLGIERAVRQALADAAMGPDEIDFVNLHGTGTPANDLAESRMLHRVFGSRVRSLPVTSTKSLVGHYLGAAGAVEAVATLVGLATGRVHPTAGEGTVDPDLGVDLVVGEPRVLDARRALSTNLAFGGANAAAIFARGARGWA